MSRESVRERFSDAFWLLPALCVATAGAAAVGMIELDERLQRRTSGFAFTGGPSSARELLSSIASSMLTLTALVFSITIVVLQLTSSQFSPRVLRTFLQDRQIQLSLGTFLATFVYTLVVLRAVRGEDGLVDRFIPGRHQLRVRSRPVEHRRVRAVRHPRRPDGAGRQHHRAHSGGYRRGDRATFARPTADRAMSRNGPRPRPPGPGVPLSSR